jgi:hypothetical protein
MTRQQAPTTRRSAVVGAMVMITTFGMSLAGCERNDNVTIVNTTDQDLMTQRVNADGDWYDAQALPAKQSVTFAIYFNATRCTSQLGIRVVDPAGAIIEEFTKACAGDRLSLKVP